MIREIQGDEKWDILDKHCCLHPEPNGILFEDRLLHYVLFAEGNRLFRVADVMKDWMRLTGLEVRQEDSK